MYQAKELLGLVALPNLHQIRLYPYSLGMNRGQGSKIPMTENALLIDLSDINKVIEVNQKHLYDTRRCFLARIRAVKHVLVQSYLY